MVRRLGIPVELFIFGCVLVGLLVGVIIVLCRQA